MLDSLIIGAGVVGLAIARRLAQSGQEVIVAEKEELIGSHTSSRNSEVIHAGIYYPQDSVRARLCVKGKWQLYDYCASHHVPHRRCGKLIVATSENELETLEGLKAKAAANGVDDLEFITAAQARELEPALSCVAALLSPSTGIIDSHGLMLAYHGDAEAAGAFIALKNEVRHIRFEGDHFRVTLKDPDGNEEEIETRRLVNSAGLYAPQMARRIEGYDGALAPTDYYCKGNYFGLTGKQPFSRLIYPVPEAAGLGVHVTVDIAGRVRFGPDVEWIEGIDYQMDPQRADVFYDAIRKYFPDLEDGQLQPAYCGVRPKITGQGEAAADFVIQGPQQHGIKGLVQLFGIESPGLTASMAIADDVQEMLA